MGCVVDQFIKLDAFVVRFVMAARLLGMRVRIPPGAWVFVSCECCVLSGTGLCAGPIPSSVESY